MLVIGPCRVRGSPLGVGGLPNDFVGDVPLNNTVLSAFGAGHFPVFTSVGVARGQCGGHAAEAAAFLAPSVFVAFKGVDFPIFEELHEESVREKWWAFVEEFGRDRRLLFEQREFLCQINRFLDLDLLACLARFFASRGRVTSEDWNAKEGRDFIFSERLKGRGGGSDFFSEGLLSCDGCGVISVILKNKWGGKVSRIELFSWDRDEARIACVGAGVDGSVLVGITRELKDSNSVAFINFLLRGTRFLHLCIVGLCDLAVEVKEAFAILSRVGISHLAHAE